MSTQTIELSTADGPMDLYEATPDGAQPKGAIIVIQEAFGVNDHIEDVARRFADAGLPRGRAGDLPPRRRRHGSLRRLQQGDAAVRGPRPTTAC